MNHILDLEDNQIYKYRKFYFKPFDFSFSSNKNINEGEEFDCGNVNECKKVLRIQNFVFQIPNRIIIKMHVKGNWEQFAVQQKVLVVMKMGYKLKSTSDICSHETDCLHTSDCKYY